MGNKGRWEYLRAIYERYRRAGRKAKKMILDEFCANTKYHRKYAIRLLSGPPPEKRRRPPRRRGLSYSQETLAVLQAVWEAAGYPWSVRLKALLPEWMPWIRKRLGVGPEIEKQLLKISARQIDRRLQGEKTQRRRRLYGRTKPGYLLKHQSHCGEDRSLGCGESRFHGSRSGGAFGQFCQWRIRAHAQCHRHSQHVDGIAGGAGTRGRACAAGLK